MKALRCALVAAAAAGTLSCGSATRLPAALPAPGGGEIAGLELVGEFNIPPLTEFAKLKAARFGGVSGLAIDPKSREILGICDDRRESRVFVFRLPEPANGDPFRVDLHAYFPLPEDPAAPAALDPEGIALSRGGRLFVSSEGVQNEEPRIPPAIVEYTRNYAFVRQLAVPAKFIPPATGPIAHGVRGNAAFESLTLTPDERYLYTANETALAQDGPEASTTTGSTVRILEYESSGSTYEPRRELAYAVDPMGPLDFTPRLMVIGLVELLALGGTEFLAMERGYAEEAGDNPRSTNRIRIFRVSIGGATDVSAFASLSGRGGIVNVRKALLLDLSTVKDLSPELANLDNFEGMVFGPTLADGSRSLLIVSDDNFNQRQRTSFLLFRVK